jgi:hypothetical protein
MNAALARLGAGGPPLLRPAAWVVAKHFWRTPPPAVVGLLASVTDPPLRGDRADVLPPDGRDAPRCRAGRECRADGSGERPEEAAR